MIMDLGLKDRAAIVTGSSQGIGKAIALGLSEEGAKVTICARNEKQLKQTAEEIQSATGGEIHTVQADLTRRVDIRNLIAKTSERFGRIDILVNNTGGPPSTTFSETSENQWRDAVNLLLMSVVTTCLEVIPHMQERKWGRIINMTSFAAKQPAERLVLSNTLRAGIFGLSKTLSNELAKNGILVNAVCPGWTLTKRVEELAKAQSKATGNAYEDIIHGWENQIPLKRLAKPKEMADLVVFLASERASYITGAVIQVDGGVIKGLL
jgi:3-oxoacyl-[acyl-carrier protein] reductase